MIVQMPRICFVFNKYPSYVASLGSRVLFLLHASPAELLRSCNEVATKLHQLRISCASPACPHPSVKESAKGGDAKRCLLHGWDAGETPGILNGPTLQQPRYNFVAASSDLASKNKKCAPERPHFICAIGTQTCIMKTYAT